MTKRQLIEPGTLTSYNVRDCSRGPGKLAPLTSVMGGHRRGWGVSSLPSSSVKISRKVVPLTVSGDRRRDLDLPCAASPRILRGRIEQAGKVSRWFGIFRLEFGAPNCLRLYDSVSNEYLRPVSVAVVSVFACPHLSLHCPMHRPRNYILDPRRSEQSGGRRVKCHTKTRDFCASEKATNCSSCSRSGPISKSLRTHREAPELVDPEA